MKKKLSLIFAFMAAMALSVAALAGCSSNSSEGSDAASGDAAASNELIVGFDQSYPPYGFVGDDGNFTGFDLDLAAEVAERNGWTVKYEPIDWDAKDTLLNSGAITCIWNGFTMEGREDDYTFSDPYMLNGQVIVVKADKGIASLDDLAGKNVITQTDSAALDVLEGDRADLAATFANLETIAEYNTAFMQLESGAVDAVACDLSIAQYQMSAKPDAYVMLDETLSSEHYAIGFKKGDTETAEKVSQTLKEMYEDGTVEELCNKYSEYGLSFENWLIK
ncbi:amino acid ABC transporter substrate-binding protein [Slackia piriformis]|uniref:amino acid ABC transporter substrate-binding protein n=1 Tax=Slackia piriformis TaxID=626934 RepID=UPI0026DC014B|nr:amino acid ABC transporter substrate-binding protein [Slackia piriformis]MDO5024586.1 amino acid ABC transporter substrate-binding protein [Slackia piriformis]